jgi:sugar-specific transcriptional regulator TrmB
LISDIRPKMKHENRGELVELGLSPTEAQIYLALLQNASIGASALAGLTGLSRSRVYQTLCSLTDKGLVESGAGYGSKFAVVPPEQALPALVQREEESLAERKSVAGRLGQRLAALADPVETAPEELIQILRNPRAVADRFDRLQLEAEKQIDIFTKPPFFIAAANRAANPALVKALRRGVHARSLYEKAAIDDPAIGPYLSQWITAGEEARVYDGELPHKLAIFDKQIVLMPLIMPADQTRTVLIRHPQLAQSLSMLFEFLWREAEPISAPASRKITPRVTRSNNHDGKRARA